MVQQQIKLGTLPFEADRRSVDSELVPTLRLMRNGNTIQELALDTPEVLIGRMDGNDIPIPTPYVSKHHAVLIRSGCSTILIDLNSTNGTFVRWAMMGCSTRRTM